MVNFQYFAGSLQHRHYCTRSQEEDFCMLSLSLKKGCNTHASVEVGSCSVHEAGMQVGASKVIGNETSKPTANNLITNYFRVSANVRKKTGSISTERQELGKSHPDHVHKRLKKTNPVNNRKLKDIPLWCTIPGTQFRVVMSLLTFHLLVNTNFHGNDA